MADTEREAFEAWNDSLGQESFGIRSIPNLPPAAWAAWQARAALASRPAEVDDWISVEDRLPGKERCLAAYVNAMGKHRIIRAMYADQFQIDAGEDAIDQGNCEYNEADDTFYLKAGWLECIDNWDDYSSIYVTEGTVTHWRRLPASPSNTTNKEK